MWWYSWTSVKCTEWIAPSWHEALQTHRNQPGCDDAHQLEDWRKQTVTPLRHHPTTATPWRHWENRTNGEGRTQRHPTGNARCFSKPYVQPQVTLMPQVCTSDTFMPARISWNSTHKWLQFLHSQSREFKLRNEHKLTTVLIHEQTWFILQWGTLSSDLFKVQLAVLRSISQPELASFYSLLKGQRTGSYFVASLPMVVCF